MLVKDIIALQFATVGLLPGLITGEIHCRLHSGHLGCAGLGITAAHCIAWGVLLEVAFATIVLLPLILS